MTQKTIITPEYPNGISVEYTAQEIAQQQIDEQNEVVRKQAEDQKKQGKIEAKASALAKLSALGLTEEEVQAIIK
jgi:hypothetical protein